MALFPTRERLTKSIDRQIDHQIAGGLGGIDQSFAAIPPCWLPRRPRSCQPLRVNAERQAPKALPAGVRNRFSFETAAMLAAAK